MVEGTPVIPFVALIIYLIFFIFVLLFVAISALITGAMIGAVPLMCGLMNGKKNLGIIGFFVCLAAYWMVGLFFALIACLIFVYFILKEKKADPAKETAVEEVKTEE